MVTHLKNKSSFKGQIAIVASSFNDYITNSLLKSCLEELKKKGLTDKQVTTLWVPGCFEIPVAALKLAKKKNIEAVICLGAVIRGDTYHFEVVANEVSRGMMNVSLQTGKPIVMGVLTTDTIAQAQKRAQTKGYNKGQEAAITALEMIDLLKNIS